MTLLMLYQDPSMNWEREGCSIDEIGRSCKEEKGSCWWLAVKRRSNCLGIPLILLLCCCRWEDSFGSVLQVEIPFWHKKKLGLSFCFAATVQLID